MSENRKTEGLKALGRETGYLETYNPNVLETFENKHQDNDYWVRFNCPEFTSVCPITCRDTHQLHPRQAHGGVEESEALPLLLPQPRRLP